MYFRGNTFSSPEREQTAVQLPQFMHFTAVSPPYLPSSFIRCGFTRTLIVLTPWLPSSFISHGFTRTLSLGLLQGIPRVVPGSARARRRLARQRRRAADPPGNSGSALQVVLGSA